MKNIIVPIDLSGVTSKVMDNARALAKAFDAKLWIIHVAAPEPDFVGFKTGPQYVRDHLADQLRKEHSAIQELAGDCAKQGIDAEALLVQGPTAETIVMETRRLGADAIVMGSHGHGALFRAFVGSVSQQVLHESPVPVMVVPAERENA